MDRWMDNAKTSSQERCRCAQSGTLPRQHPPLDPPNPWHKSPLWYKCKHQTLSSELPSQSIGQLLAHQLKLDLAAVSGYSGNMLALDEVDQFLDAAL